MGSIPTVAATTPNLMVLKDQTISIYAKFALHLQNCRLSILLVKGGKTDLPSPSHFTIPGHNHW